MPPNAKRAPSGSSAQDEDGNDGTHTHDNNNDSNSAVSSTRRTSRRKSNSVQKERSLQSYIPMYLRRYVLPYHGDFCYTFSFHPNLIVQLMAEGFLPIATEGLLLPKLHLQRCVVLTDQLHKSKSARKKARRFSISINTSFADVVAGCRRQHGTNCWLYPELVEAFAAMYQGTVENQPLQAAFPSSSSSSSRDGAETASSGTCPVRLYSIEIWSNDNHDEMTTTTARDDNAMRDNNDDDDDDDNIENKDNWVLVGGELGYTVGSIYTSLTGFSSRDSAGSVQLACTGKMLFSAGFTVWDLGMDMDYKRSLGAQLVPRDDFVRMVHSTRERDGHTVQLGVPAGRVNARSIMDA
jgi:Leu/Phe-tRNA-protein transferase